MGIGQGIKRGRRANKGCAKNARVVVAEARQGPLAGHVVGRAEARGLARVRLPRAGRVLRVVGAELHAALGGLVRHEVHQLEDALLGGVGVWMSWCVGECYVEVRSIIVLAHNTVRSRITHLLALDVGDVDRHVVLDIRLLDVRHGLGVVPVGDVVEPKGQFGVVGGMAGQLTLQASPNNKALDRPVLSFELTGRSGRSPPRRGWRCGRGSPCAPRTPPTSPSAGPGAAS